MTTDVMLVQALLVAFFFDPTLKTPAKDRARGIITSSGKRFDDGIYGPKTRAVVGLFEETVKSPHKDGIIRRVPFEQTFDGPDTKLKKLNFAWNMTMPGDTGSTKKESGRAALNRLLFNELYPRG
jgi:hypothetical protein